MVTVFMGLAVHGLITLPILLFFIGGVKPIAHFRAVTGALMTAFSTASSSATLPLTIDSVRKNAGVSKNVSGFVLPLGATINMDGTALYECVAAIFIAQAYGIELSMTQQLLVVFTALLASIGAAAVPMAGLVMIVIILRAVGLPLEGVGLILAVDRILDMTRTCVNVWSDTCGAVIIARSEGELKG
jgi:Na+/H+-dicarboxylate symporter